MSLQTWQETLITMPSDPGAISNTTTPTSLLTSTARAILPANTMTPGKMFRVTASGRLSCINPTPGNITFDVRMGPTANITVFTGGAVPLNTAAAKTNVTWWLEILLTCRTGGLSGNLLGVGFIQSEAVDGAAAGKAESVSLPATAPAVGTSFDGQGSMQVDLYGTFSVANAGNSITAHQYMLEALN